MSFLIVLISSLFAIANATKPTKGSVFYYPSGHSYQFVPGLIDPNAAAFGSFQQTSESNGWGQLVIESNINFETSVQAHAAGYLEGVLTSEEIQNTVLNFGTPALSTHVEMFLVKNALFLAQSCGFAAKKDPYWSTVCAMHEQLHGLAAGYESVSGKSVADYQWFHLYNIQNSLGDIDTAFSKQTNKPYVRENSKCSGFVRKTDTDLFVSQATWTEFNQLGRVLKSYNFPWHGVANQNVSFSSYPGMIWSSDDFYQVDDRFAVFETTADVVNATLWRALSPNTVLTMFRTMTANRLAVSSESWSKEFAKYNSGTYNNQFFVVDYYRAKQRLPNNDLPSDTVWMTEQLPGYIKHGDITDLINRDSYFGSFNLWYWPETVKKSGLPALVKEHGSWFVYDKCPRYNIFKRGMAAVLDEHSAKQIIRFNEFKTDPLSVDPVRSAENAIAARSDLNPANKHYPFAALGPRCHGAIDAKLTSMKLQASKTFTAVAGPTWGAQSGSDNLPPFAWDQVTNGHPCYPYATKHVGQLNKPYAFDWMLFSQQ